MSSAFKRDDWTAAALIHASLLIVRCVSGEGREEKQLRRSAYLNWPSQRVFHLLHANLFFRATFLKCCREKERDGSVFLLPSGSGYGWRGLRLRSLRVYGFIWHVQMFAHLKCDTHVAFVSGERQQQQQRQRLVPCCVLVVPPLPPCSSPFCGTPRLAGVACAPFAAGPVNLSSCTHAHLDKF